MNMSSGIFNKFTGYHNRRSIRLDGYDYSRPGFYFVTICIHDRKQRLFGNVANGKMILNEMGKIAFDTFNQLPERFPNMKPHVFQIMPNHVHAIIAIHVVPVGATLAVARNPVAVAQYIPVDGPTKQNRAGASPAPTNITEPTENTDRKMITENAKTAIGDIVGAYKSLVANGCLKIHKSKNEHMGKLWQRNYYEHVIRDEKSLFAIRKYILENPMNWDFDSENHIDMEIREFGLTE
jgi:putative transposase